MTYISSPVCSRHGTNGSLYIGLFLSLRSCFLDSPPPPPLLTSSSYAVASPLVAGASSAAVTAAFLRQWPIAVADLILALGWNMEEGNREGGWGVVIVSDRVSASKNNSSVKPNSAGRFWNLW